MEMDGDSRCLAMAMSRGKMTIDLVAEVDFVEGSLCTNKHVTDVVSINFTYLYIEHDVFQSVKDWRNCDAMTRKLILHMGMSENGVIPPMK